MLPREGGNSRDRDLGGSRGGSIPGVSKDARVRTTRARAAWKRARAGLWRRRRVPRLGEWRSPDHFVSNAPNPRALVSRIFRRHRDVTWRASPACDPTNYCCRRREKAARTLSCRISTRRAGRRTRASEPDPRGSLRTRGAPRWAPAAAAGATVGAAARAPPHASFVHLPPDVRHLRVARGAVGRGRGPRDAREARAPARGRRERDHGS